MARRGSYAKGVAKREEILTTALAVIARNGYRRTSLRELAEAVELSQAGLLHYFGSKEELFAEILRKRDEADASSFLKEGAGEDAFSALVPVVRHNSQVPGLVQLYVQLSTEALDPEHPSHGFFLERSRVLRRLLTEAIRERQALGQMRADPSAERIALLLIALMDGLQAQWLADPDIDMAEHLEAFMALISS